LGTTKRGIGPTYDTLNEHYNISINREQELKELKELRDTVVGKNMIIDSATYLNKSLRDGKRILIEGN
jgi:adenylosuccinate synthase